MAGAVTIKDHTPKVLRIVTKLTSGALIDFTEGAVARAQEKSPLQTGHNKREITWHSIGKNSTKIETSSGYGGYLELGTSKMPARPYFAPSFREMIRIFTNNKRWK